MTKSQQCIICTSLYRKNVDELLAKGIKYPTIVKFLQDKAIKISITSVGRHNNNHRLAKLAKKISRGKATKKKTSMTKRKKKGQVGHIGAVTKLQKEKRADAAELSVKSRTKSRKTKLLKDLSDMSQDIDVMQKMQEIIILAEDRLYRSLLEEKSTQLVLTITSNAFKDYSKALKDYHEITAGLDSATQLRFAQMVNLVGNVFVGQPMSDKARHDMLEMMNEHDLDAIPEPPVVEKTDSNIETKVVTIDASELSTIGTKTKSNKKA